LVEPSTEKRKYWMDVIDYLTEEKNEEKNQIAEVVQVTDRKFLWLNVWKQNLIDNYFVTTHRREDLADKVIDEELRDIHVVKLKIEL
jgi:capsule polysaccharide export protein KpsC/LpsZ